MKIRVYIAYGEENLKFLIDIYDGAKDDLKSYVKSLLAKEAFIDDVESYLTKESPVCVVYDAEKVDKYLNHDIWPYMLGDEARYILRNLAISIKGANYIAYADKYEGFNGKACDWFFDDGLEVYGAAGEHSNFYLYFKDKYLGSIYTGDANGYIDIISDLLSGSHPFNDKWEDGLGNSVSFDG